MSQREAREMRGRGCPTPHVNREYFETASHWESRALSLVHLQVLGILDRAAQDLANGARVLDAGCGDGIVIQRFIEMHPSLRGAAVDMSWEALSKVASPIEAVYSDLLQLPFPNNSFHLTWCLDVFEHLSADQLTAALQELMRITCGKLLVVSPFLESNAIKTQCIRCGTIFSPYYHTTAFSLHTWKALVREALGAGFTATFMPLGVLKPHLPQPAGTLLLNAGMFVTHGSTTCPLCRTTFTRTHVSQRNLNELLGPYIEKHLDSFGCCCEEMGVLIERTARVSAVCSGTYAMVETQRSSAWRGELHYTSPYGIDLSDDRSVRQEQDLFASPAYALDPGCLGARLERDGNGMRPFVLSREAPRVLQLMLPPHRNGQTLPMVLVFLAEQPVAVQISAFSRKTNTYELLAEGTYDRPQELSELAFEVPSDTGLVTPYGIILSVLFEAPKSSNDSVIYLVSLQYRDEQKKTVELHPGRNVLEREDCHDAVLQLTFPEGRPDRLLLSIDGFDLDFTAFVCTETNNTCRLPSPLWLTRCSVDYQADIFADQEILSNLADSTQELEQTRAQLVESRMEASRTRTALEQRRQELEQTYRALSETRAALEQTKEACTTLESQLLQKSGWRGGVREIRRTLTTLVLKSVHRMRP